MIHALAASETGAGSPTFLLVHGAACDRSDWQAQLDDLGRNHNVVAVDLPGHGQSPSAPDLTIEMLGEAVAGFALDRGYRRIILVGHSFACRVVLDAAVRLRDRLAGIVLLDGTNFATPDIGRGVDEIRASMRQAGFDRFVAASFAAMFVEGSDPALRQRIVDRAVAWASDDGEAIVLNTIGWDGTRADATIAEVAALNLPVLMLQSTYVDHRFGRRSLEPGMTTPWTEKIQRAMPAARLDIIPGAGHFPHVEQADAVTDALRAFAERF